jgi:hypothetical protein
MNWATPNRRWFERVGVRGCYRVTVEAKQVNYLIG